MAKSTPTYSAFPRLKNRKVSSAGQWEIHPDHSRLSSFLIFTGIALFWNGISWGVFFNAQNARDSGIKVVGLIFCGIGLFLVFLALKNLLRLLTVGDTYFLTGSDIMAPGESQTVQVYHTGRYDIDNVLVRLRCQERASEKRGKETKTMSRDIYDAEIFQGGKRFSKPDMPLYEFPIKIPEDAPYSFVSKSQRIVWLLNIKLILPGRPDMDLNYTLRVGCKQLAESE